MKDSLSNDTIVAPATVPGTGALSIVRISGPKALEVCDNVLSRKISSLGGYSLVYSSIDKPDGTPLDSVMVSVFRAPHSYTGEDSAEICCHASKYIVSELISLLCNAGARMAGPGEFTKRAFLNGKIDLSQAEAVADVIASSSEASHRVATNQLRGGYSNELEGLREELVKILSKLELELDFSEEDVEFADRNVLRSLIQKTCSHVEKFISSFRQGNAIKNGIPVAIAGSVNSGKSTLLNALLNEDRAIVSSCAGTTRDTIEETITLNGLDFRFIDTAGLRATDDEVESEGIRRSHSKIKSAEMVLIVIDSTIGEDRIIDEIRELVQEVDTATQKTLILLNKSDKKAVNINVSNINKVVSSLEKEINILSISAKEGQGIDKLKNTLAEAFSDINSASFSSLVTNSRHLEAFKTADKFLKAAQDGLDSNSPTDLIAQDIREAIEAISSITGRTITPDTILHNIFASHCIGK